MLAIEYKLYTQNQKMIQIIKDKSDLRTGNLVLVDSLVLPPNFIAAQPQRLGDGWEDYLNKGFDNCAFLNITEIDMIQLFGEKLEKNGVKVFEIEKEGFRNLPKWEMTYKDNRAEVSFMHQVQNYFEDWTGQKLI